MLGLPLPRIAIQNTTSSGAQGFYTTSVMRTPAEDAILLLMMYESSGDESKIGVEIILATYQTTGRPSRVSRPATSIHSTVSLLGVA